MKRGRDTVEKSVFEIGGIVGRYVESVSRYWLETAPLSNPGMLEMLRDRDAEPPRDLVPWAGEFPGKYLTAATQTLVLTGEKRLRRVLERFVAEFVSCQAEDGYLGPWPRAFRLVNRMEYPDGRTIQTWDTWGHYHAMLGLLVWHQHTGDPAALNAARRIGDALVSKFAPDVSPRMAETGCTEMNLAPAHSLALLYKVTKEKAYLELAQRIVEKEFRASGPDGAPLAGDYLRAGLEGLEFYEIPRPRWESLHPVMALAELYTVTGDRRYLSAFCQHWNSIRRLDRHNNGGFSSGEQAQGNPYDMRDIETCCTVAWMAMTVEYLKLTGESCAADELELSLFNSVIGQHSRSGRWATYSTPMNGVRRASYHHIVFQSREGSPELNCCSVNSPRGFGLLSEWAILPRGNGLAINFYGPCRIQTRIPNGISVELVQTTDYPLSGVVKIAVNPSRPAHWSLSARIPCWSSGTRVTINGKPVRRPSPGRYLTLRRCWKRGDTIEITLDMSLHAWPGAEECEGKASLFRGPILLAYDRRFNRTASAPPRLSAESLLSARQADTREYWLKPFLLLETSSEDGRTVKLCDFGSAGEGGTPYFSWLPVSEAEKIRPSPFAPSELDAVVIRLARLSKLFPKFSQLACSIPSNDPVAAQRWLIERILALPDALKAYDSGWQLARSQTDFDAAAQLRRRLHLLMLTGLLQDRYVCELRRKLEAVCSESSCAQRIIWEVEAGPLYPRCDDIRAAQPPGPDVEFRRIPFDPSTELADIRQIHGGRDGFVFVKARLNMPGRSAGKLLYGADGPVKVWINGSEADCRPEARNPARIGQYEAPAGWMDGANTVIFGINTNEGRAWGVVARAIAGNGQ